jgi:phosphoglycerate dehydrogenase-like enzyme
MTNLLILMTHPEPIRRQYYDFLRANFPELEVNVVDHHSKVGPYIGSAEILLTYGNMMADHVLQEGPNVKWIHTLTTGTDGFEKLPSLRPEILLTSTRGIYGPAMSEAALMAMLALSRNLPTTMRNQEQHVWERPRVTLLDGKTVGIFSLGLIGAALVPKCKVMGMKVIGVDPLQPSVPAADRVLGWDEGMRAVAEMDYIVSFIPSMPQTRGSLDRKFFAKMKPTGYFINLGRGDVVDEGALLDALREKRIAGAALDVFSPEPLPSDHPYWTLSNVIITPHLGGVFDDSPKRAMPIVEENVRRYLAGDFENMINRVKH